MRVTAEPQACEKAPNPPNRVMLTPPTIERQHTPARVTHQAALARVR